MRSPSPDPCPPRGDPDLVVVAIAARGLAAAARRAGFAPIVLDLFGDDDTRALASEAIPLRRQGGFGFDPDDLFEQLALHGAGDLPVVLGTGFEAAPDVVAQIERRFRLVGNGASTLARLKEPMAFMQLLRDLDVPHPAVFAGPVPAGVPALEKRVGGSGGSHVRPARLARGEGWYMQERLEGRTVSALFLGDGREARLIGFSEQWCAPTGIAPFRYGGAAGPIALEPGLADAVMRALGRLAAATGLVGLASADLILTGADRWSLIEVNPRPGATLDIFDRLPFPPLLRLHLDACAGRLPDATEWVGPANVPVKAAAIFYAPAPVTVRLDPLPDWVADRPPQGTRIEADEPVCTVFGQGRTVAEARAQIEQRTHTLWLALTDASRNAAE